MSGTSPIDDTEQSFLVFHTDVFGVHVSAQIPPPMFIFFTIVERRRRQAASRRIAQNFQFTTKPTLHFLTQRLLSISSPPPPNPRGPSSRPLPSTGLLFLNPKNSSTSVMSFPLPPRRNGYLATPGPDDDLNMSEKGGREIGEWREDREEEEKMKGER